MRVTLECGCSVDDERVSTVHEAGDDRSLGDQQREKHHYPLEASSPSGFCVRCDLHRPCGCDKYLTKET